MALQYDVRMALDILDKERERYHKDAKEYSDLAKKTLNPFKRHEYEVEHFRCLDKAWAITLVKTKFILSRSAEL